MASSSTAATTATAIKAMNASTLPALRRRLPLTAVSLVYRNRPGLESLASFISAFIAPVSSKNRWPIESACERGDLQLLQRLIAHEAPFVKDPHYRSHIFSKAIVHAIRQDNLSILECLIAYSPNGFTSKGMEEAALLGKVHLMQWLADHCPNLVWSKRFTDNAASAGHLDALKWLKEYAGADRQQYLVTAIQEAAFSGQLAAVEWLHESANPELIEHREWHQAGALYSAIRGGHLEVVKYLHEKEYKLNGVYWGEIDLATTMGNLELVKWLHANSYEDFSESSFESAAENGSVDLIRRLLVNGPQPLEHDRAIQGAAKNGHLEIVQLLQEFATPKCYERALTDAALNGHLDIVQWLYDNLREGSSSDGFDLAYGHAVRQSTVNGHLEIAQWLHARTARQGHPSYRRVESIATNDQERAVQWKIQNAYHFDSSFAMLEAARSGDLEMAIWRRNECGCGARPRPVLKWIHENRAGVCTSEGVGRAAENGHLHVLNWLHETRIEGFRDNAMDLAAQNNHLHVAQWLHENRHEGCTKAAMDAAASIEMVQWLHANRTEGCTTEAMTNAARKGDFETLLFLHEHRSEGCDVYAAVMARLDEHVDIFQWLLDNYPDVMKIEDVREAISHYHGFRTEYVSPLLTVDERS